MLRTDSGEEAEQRRTLRTRAAVFDQPVQTVGAIGFDIEKSHASSSIPFFDRTIRTPGHEPSGPDFDPLFFFDYIWI